MGLIYEGIPILGSPTVGAATKLALVVSGDVKSGRQLRPVRVERRHLPAPTTNHSVVDAVEIADHRAVTGVAE